MQNEPLLCRPQKGGQYELYQFTYCGPMGMRGSNSNKVIIASNLSKHDAEYMCELWLKNMENDEHKTAA